MSGLPTGTVTFLFTDIEGSTERWELHRAAMQAALERHDILLRAAIEIHRGYVFKTVGDAFCAAFHTPLEALGAAIDAQRAVAEEDWPAYGPGFPPIHVRMGIHTGVAQERGGDYFGPAVNRTARLEAAGHGGQVLMSLATQQLVQGELPSNWAVRDWGTHRLKDLRNADRIFQVLAPGLLDVVTPLRIATALSPRERIIVQDALMEGEADGGVPATAEGTGIRRPGNMYEAMAATLAAVREDEGTSAVLLSAAQAREAAERRPADLTEYRLGRIAEWSQPRFRLDGRFVALTLLVDQGEEAMGGRWAARQERYDDLGALLAAVIEPAVVVLGPPGSGKSTLLRHLELDLAIANLRSEDARDTVTFFIQLNQYRPESMGGSPPLPGAWLADRWAAAHPDLPGLDTLLAEGRVILLLDALNEMPAASEQAFRERVGLWKDWLVRLAREQPGNRVLFTCRTLDYSASLSTQALRVPQLQIEPLTDAQVAEFLRAYSPVRGAEIWAAIAGTPQLDALRAPFFLTLLVDQVEATGDLAGDRAGLFTGFVRQALRREVERDNPLFASAGVVGMPSVGAQPAAPLLATRDLRRIAQWQWRDTYELPERGVLVPRLAALAYGMQLSEADGEASQVRLDYDAALVLVDHERREDIVKAGLAISVLDEDPVADEVLYRHQLIQEYFAARVLAKAPNPELVRREWRAVAITPGVPEILETLSRAESLPALPQTGWEETVLLAAAMVGDAEAYLWGLMGTNLALAGRCAGHAVVLGRLGEGLLKELRLALVARSRDPEADLRDRIACGLALGELGDPRFERRVGAHGVYLWPPLVEILGGSYPVGEDEPFGESVDTIDEHVPRHRVAIRALNIGRFPVTNAEYACFMAAGGYEDERWWESSAARAWRYGEGTAAGILAEVRYQLDYYRAHPEYFAQLRESSGHASGGWDEETYERYRRRLAMTDEELEAHLQEMYPGGRETEPRYWRDLRYNNGAQPVVGVCWHEARAYCAWLAAQTGQMMRLPTEVEWEAAARGIAGRLFAYGERFDPVKGNTLETRLNRPSPVGVFAEGDTPEGLADMSGNVGQWTLSLWGRDLQKAAYRYPYDAADGREDLAADPVASRVVRGGAWNNPRQSARAAFRSRLSPALRQHNQGFRIVSVCPPTS